MLPQPLSLAESTNPIQTSPGLFAFTSVCVFKFYTIVSLAWACVSHHHNQDKDQYQHYKHPYCCPFIITFTSHPPIPKPWKPRICSPFILQILMSHPIWSSHLYKQPCPIISCNQLLYNFTLLHIAQGEVNLKNTPGHGRNEFFTLLKEKAIQSKKKKLLYSGAYVSNMCISTNMHIPGYKIRKKPTYSGKAFYKPFYKPRHQSFWNQRKQCCFSVCPLERGLVQHFIFHFYEDFYPFQPQIKTFTSVHGHSDFHLKKCHFSLQSIRHTVLYLPLKSKG